MVINVNLIALQHATDVLRSNKYKIIPIGWFRAFQSEPTRLSLNIILALICVMGDGLQTQSRVVQFLVFGS